MTKRVCPWRAPFAGVGHGKTSKGTEPHTVASPEPGQLRLIHGRAIGDPHARLARRWVSRLDQQVPQLLWAVSTPEVEPITVAPQLQISGNWRNIRLAEIPLAESARLMPVIASPVSAISPESREPKGLEISVDPWALHTPNLPLSASPPSHCVRHTTDPVIRTGAAPSEVELLQPRRVLHWASPCANSVVTTGTRQ